jgi:gliding motility-associated-like protein
MKSFVLIFACFFVFEAVSQKKTELPLPNETAKSSFAFVENKNQWGQEVAYRADLPSGFLQVSNNALQYTFYDGKAVAYYKHKEFYKNIPEYAQYEKQEGIKAHSFVVEFLGANPVRVQAKNPLPTLYHYYLGEKSHWAENVRAYTEIIYPEIYQGISYHLFSKASTLKYEIAVQAGANPKQIRLRYNYADKVELLPDGSLLIATQVGNIYEKKPISYQNIRGKKVLVPTEFVLENNVLSFRFPKGYDKRYELIIDPELVFSTYSGGISDNWGNTATFDDAGNLYSGATLFGLSFPNFTGPITIGTTGSGGTITDVGIFKYNPTGTTLLQLTFIGGLASEVPHSLVVDSQNNLFALGTTSSTNFPATIGTYQGGTSLTPIAGISYSNGSDIFIVKLNPTGTLNVALLLGGTGNDGLKPSGGTTIHNYGDEFRGDIYVDANDNVYIASTTRSNTITGFTGTLNGLADGIVAKFNNNLGLLWGRYLGGTGIDIALSIKTNQAGDVYVGGGTTSTNLPNTTGALNPSALGNDDGFIARYDANGTLLRITYLGTSAADMAFFIDLDSDEEIYAFGQTFGNYPTSSGVYNNGNSGQFIHKISPDLATSRWSTRVGAGDGNPDISPTAFLVVTENNCNNIYIAGWGGTSLNGPGSSTANLPTTEDAYRRTTVNGRDFYIAVYKRNMERLLYATFFGENASNEVGDHVDGGTSRFSKNGTIYHSVCASCGGTNGFPTTAGAWSNSNNSTNCNNAVFKFRLNVSADFQMINPRNSQIISDGGETCEARIAFKFTALDADDFLWEILDAGNNVIFSQNTQKDFTYTFTVSGLYRVRLTVTNCNQTDQKTQDINIIIPNFQVQDSVAICRGESVQLQASGATTYLWKPSTGLNNPNIPNPIASPTQTTVYTLTFQDTKCKVDKKVKVQVLPVLDADFSFKILKDCNTPYRVKLSLPANLDTTKFVKFTWDMGDGNTLEGTNPPEYIYKEPNKTYQVTLLALNPNGCNTRVRKDVQIPAPPIEPPNAITPNGDGINDTFEVAEAGSKLQIWNRWGKRIFKSDNYKNDWGKDVAAGTYYYLLENPSGVKCNGWIQVLK